MEPEKCHGTVLALDISLELAAMDTIRDTWERSKTIALLVCQALVRTGAQPPTVIAYNEKPRLVSVEDLPELTYEFVYGTNVQGALRLAELALGGIEGPRRILVIAYAEPSAHFENDREVLFCYPPRPETMQKTLDEVRTCAAAGIRVDFLLPSVGAPFRNVAARLAEEGDGLVTTLADEVPTGAEVESILADIGMM